VPFGLVREQGDLAEVRKKAIVTVLGQSEAFWSVRASLRVLLALVILNLSSLGKCL
jgi:hypothetical protein